MSYLCQKPSTVELAIDSLSTCIKAIFDWNIADENCYIDIGAIQVKNGELKRLQTEIEIIDVY